MDTATPDAETRTTPLARAYLPEVTTRFSQIMNLEARLNKEASGSAKYLKDPDPPAGATPTAWDLHTEAALAAYRRAGAVVVTS